MVLYEIRITLQNKKLHALWTRVSYESIRM